MVLVDGVMKTFYREKSRIASCVSLYATRFRCADLRPAYHFYSYIEERICLFQQHDSIHHRLAISLWLLGQEAHVIDLKGEPSPGHASGKQYAHQIAAIDTAKLCKSKVEPLPRWACDEGHSWWHGRIS